MEGRSLSITETHSNTRVRFDDPYVSFPTQNILWFYILQDGITAPFGWAIYYDLFAILSFFFLLMQLSYDWILISFVCDSLTDTYKNIECNIS